MDRTDRYCEQLDAYLAPLSQEQARFFLRCELDRWEAEYLRFQTSDGRSAPRASAFDFITTIGAIAGRIVRLTAAPSVEGEKLCPLQMHPGEDDQQPIANKSTTHFPERSIG